MNVLELFAGSRSVGKACEARGHNVFSVDINDFENIDLVKDILNVTKKDIPFYPDMIWASPPCTTFSIASCMHHWTEDGKPKTEAAKKGVYILQKTLQFFIWYENSIWYMENPRGMMRTKVKGLDRTTVTYCSYGDKRMKPTDIWTNNLYDMFNPLGWSPRPVCFNGNTKCQHEESPRGSRTGTQGLKNNYEKSKIPEELCLEIVKATEKKLS